VVAFAPLVGRRAKPATGSKDVPRELDLTRLERPLPIVPLVDGIDGFGDRTSSVVHRYPVHCGKQLHPESALEALEVHQLVDLEEGYEGI
jgi:hypothetical protein